MSEPIRVLQVFAQMNRGGAETMIMNIYRNIDRSKIQFDFIVHTNEECAFDNEIAKLGGRIYQVPRYIGRNHLAYTRAWNTFFKNNREYKIIHGHVRSTASIYLKIARKYGLKTIVHSHSTTSGDNLTALAKNVLQFPLRYIADYFFACSEYAGEWLFGKSVKSRDNYYILKNAINTKEFLFNNEIRLKKRQDLNLEDKFVIGHIGRFHKLKNHKFLIDVFREVTSHIKNAVLLLIGDGELKEYILDKVIKMELSDKVIFAGVREDVPELLQAMDAFLFPSLHEGLPVTLIEAQAAGLPCIVSDEITKEVAITNLVKFLSLKTSISEWAKCIIEYSHGFHRNDMFQEISNAGYDVGVTSRWYQEFILNRNS